MSAPPWSDAMVGFDRPYREAIGEKRTPDVAPMTRKVVLEPSKECGLIGTIRRVNVERTDPTHDMVRISIELNVTQAAMQDAGSGMLGSLSGMAVELRPLEQRVIDIAIDTAAPAAEPAIAAKNPDFGTW